MGQRAGGIRWNSIFALLSQLIRLVANFALFVGVARIYGPEAFGQFTAAHTLSTVLLILADFGFDTLLATEVARHRASAGTIMRTYFTLKMMFAFGATLAAVLAPWVWPMSPATGLLVAIFGFGVFFTSLCNLYFALFKGVEQLQHETRISFTTNLLSLAALVVAWKLNLGLPAYAMIFVGSRVLGFILALRQAGSIVDIEFGRLEFSGWKDVLRNVSVFGFLNLFGSLCLQLDTILVASMKSSHEVGVYQAVIRVAILLLVTIDIAVSTMMPVLSRLNAEDVRKWTAMGRLLHKTLMFVALTIFSVMFSFAEQIIDVIYGVGRFTEGVPILRLFAFVVVLRYTAETYGLMLTTSGKQFPRMMVVLGATVLNLLLNLYAIPQYGIEGAAVVAILTNIVILAGYAIATRRFFSGWEASPRIIIVLAVMSALVTSLWFVRTMPVWYWGPGAIALSCAVLYYVGFTKEERYLLFRAKSNSSISST